ncbi:MAG: sigma-70 family RNA polymerase sigma factor [Planctomycetaceae bacterium]|nr:sigma-70 family RNA polymerase sigma factor [Planctomycetaceae bacterium]
MALRAYVTYIIHRVITDRRRTSRAQRTGFTSDLYSEFLTRMHRAPKSFSDFDTRELKGYSRLTAIRLTLKRLAELKDAPDELTTAPVDPQSSETSALPPVIDINALRSRLTDSDFEILVLRAEGHSFSDIAETTSSTKYNVYNAFRRARRIAQELVNADIS